MNYSHLSKFSHKYIVKGRNKDLEIRGKGYPFLKFSKCYLYKVIKELLNESTALFLNRVLLHDTIL